MGGGGVGRSTSREGTRIEKHDVRFAGSYNLPKVNSKIANSAQE